VDNRKQNHNDTNELLMAEPLETEELSADEFLEMRTGMDVQFRKYMHGRQILSTFPESTLRRYRKSLPAQPRKNKEEDALLHRMRAVLHAYQLDAIACAQSGADFASGLMASAACEGLAVVALIRRKNELRQCQKYKRLWTRQAAKKNNSRPTLSKFLLELRQDDLFSLCRSVGAYNEENLPEQVAEALRSRGHDGHLTAFVREARNCIHPRHNMSANEKYAKVLDVMYSPEGMKSFHADFALCAWELHGRLEEGLQTRKQ
jgi:hypothetical protein